ncbi:MAG: phosphate/phosphite/phosphonate ABC transporter substrate-binding protein [Oscillatoriales cyanobacterium SM2_3_0]|nr:phosphate/phosphite/phosphonate ABC transporter substrate-binding protein [Oscillatoriales cyanobacterium SM2_3_0]
MKRRNFLGYSLLFLAGCTTTTRTGSNGSSPSAPTNSVSNQTPEKLRFTVTDVQGLEALEKDYGQFRQTLEEVLETPVEFFPVESYTAAAVALQGNQVDMILTGPSEYVVINSRTKASPIVAITRQDYHSMVIVPADSSIQTLADLKGKTIAMKKSGSTSGHLGPTKLLIDAGLQPQTDYKTEMLGFPDGFKAMREGKVDAWGGSFTDFQSLSKTEGLADTDFRILQEGPPLPSDLIMVSELLPAELTAEYTQRIIDNKDKLIQALVTGEETEKYAGSELAPTQDSDYEMIREVYRAMGEESLIQ